MFRPYQQLKNVYHYVQSQFWRWFYGYPDRGLKLFGVTGTNGKTTTSYLLASIFSQVYGEDKVGMLTTVAFRVGRTEVINETKMTTLPSRLIFRYLREMKQAGVKYAVLEITSHALDQGRLAGIKLDGAIILNIAREHLDYHQTMTAYAEAKGKIINYLKPGTTVVIKNDDDLVRGIVERNKRRDIVVKTFTREEVNKVDVALLGEVNKENAVAASLLAQAVGVSIEKCSSGIMNVKSVPGRMEWVSIPGKPRFLIDYAVTPDALDRLYVAVRKESSGKIFGVLGACGLRDRGKRPDMAATVAKYADELVLTREDPWTEPEEQIFSDLEKGLDRKCQTQEEDCPREVNCRYSWCRITDRRAAIQYCLHHAAPDDVIVVTGKGAERGMAIGKKIVPWNEKEIILELLKQ